MMETTSRTGGRISGANWLSTLSSRVDSQAVAIWLLGFLLVVYLGLNGGGFEPVVRDQLGIAVWWGVILGLAVGALPLRSLRRSAWIALAALAAYVAWVALSASWSDSVDRSFADLGRVTTYLGIFALALALRGSKGARRMINAVAAGIFVIAAIGLLSRLHPAWFPEARESVAFLAVNRSRLSYPVEYWNGLAVLCAMGIPLLLYVAGAGQRIVSRSLATAALPWLALTLYFTFSRGGVLAAAVGLLVLIALAEDRVALGANVLLGAVGSAILIIAAQQRDAVANGLSEVVAHHQGNEMLAMTVVVCGGVGLLAAALAIWLRDGQRPAWTRPSRRTTLLFVSAVASVCLVALVVVLASGKAAHAWSEFKESPTAGTGSGRLQSLSSNGRIPYWTSALDEFSAHPLVGGGSGSFEAWWAQHRQRGGGFVQDAHSLYLETLGELGIVGLVLILFFIGWVLYVGVRTYIGASRSRRSQLAAALAGCATFIVAAAFDWLWELPVVPVAFLLLASVLVSAGSRSRTGSAPPAWRLAGVVAGLAALVAIAIPLSAASSIEQSQAAVRKGELARALGQAEDAVRVEPFAAAPRLQKALVLEEQNELAGARVAALAAVRREPAEWRAWVVLSRLQAKLGEVNPAIASYRKAKMLNPESLLFK
jgi:hypothetical protein